MNKTKYLNIRFKNEISQFEIPLFRGAVIDGMENANILFHNHQGEGFRYSYPLIQYKRINKKAAIICINEGAECIGQLFSSGSFDFHLGEREVKMEIESMKAEQYVIQVWDSDMKFSLRKWLPLNSENYKKYMDLEALNEKLEMLQDILIGNILSLCKGIGIHLEKEVICKITKLSDPFMVKNKNVKLMSFDIEFISNVSIPDFVGIGKNASIGYGMITRIKSNNNE